MYIRIKEAASETLALREKRSSTMKFLLLRSKISSADVFQGSSVSLFDSYIVTISPNHTQTFPFLTDLTLTSGWFRGNKFMKNMHSRRAEKKLLRRAQASPKQLLFRSALHIYLIQYTPQKGAHSWQNTFSALQVPAII